MQAFWALYRAVQVLAQAGRAPGAKLRSDGVWECVRGEKRKTRTRRMRGDGGRYEGVIVDGRL